MLKVPGLDSRMGVIASLTPALVAAGLTSIGEVFGGTAASLFLTIAQVHLPLAELALGVIRLQSLLFYSRFMHLLLLVPVDEANGGQVLVLPAKELAHVPLIAKGSRRLDVLRILPFVLVQHVG